MPSLWYDPDSSVRPGRWKDLGFSPSTWISTSLRITYNFFRIYLVNFACYVDWIFGMVCIDDNLFETLFKLNEIGIRLRPS